MTLKSKFKVQSSRLKVKRKRPRTSNLEPRTWFCGGFTLIEMAVVIVIISMVAMIVLPLLPSTDTANLRNTARSLATIIRYLGDRAVTTKVPHRMLLDLGENTVTVKKIVDGDEVLPDDPFFSRKIMAEGVSIEDVEIPRLGKLAEGTVKANFGVSGLEDALVIHLKGAKGDHYTVTALPNGRRVEVLEGYQEMKL